MVSYPERTLRLWLGLLGTGGKLLPFKFLM
jgi:hypothetical protein